MKGPPGLQGPPGTPGAGSVVYTRWGRTSCPPTAYLVYSGRTAGSWYGNTGGGVNYLCMPNNPDYSTYNPGVQGRSPLYGTEYQTSQRPQRPLCRVSHTTRECSHDRVSHQSSDTINSRTVLCKNEATNPVTIYIRV